MIRTWVYHGRSLPNSNFAAPEIPSISPSISQKLIDDLFHFPRHFQMRCDEKVMKASLD